MAEESPPLTQPQFAKPRVRMDADGSLLTLDSSGKLWTKDSFTNFLTRTGINAGNLSGAGSYSFNPISRNRLKVEWSYRSSWIVGTIVDVVAEDMTSQGIEIQSDASPDEVSKFEKSQLSELCVWQGICDTEKWARLYGGAIGFIMIDGQKPETPLDPESVSKGQFRGVFPLDRWAVFPSLGPDGLVSDYGPDLGQPKSYEVRPDYGTGLPYMKIHYSRVIRLEGVRLPYWQRITENLWGQSVIERLFDRLVAFDSATQGAAQLVYKAHLRTYAVEGLRKIIAAGGPALDGLLKQMDMVRKYQSSEGMTLMDASDRFEVHPYTFTGLDDVLLQFGQQLSGASQIPLVRLFGQSPAGLNATGESDLKMYDDGIARRQTSSLDRGMGKVYTCAWRSEHGDDPPEDWKLAWRPLRKMDDTERAAVGTSTTEAIMKPYDAGLTPASVTLKELRQQSRVTGLFTNIDDKMIKAAEADDGGEVPTPEDLGVVPADPNAPPGKGANGAGGAAVRPPAQAAGPQRGGAS
jgi:phage-related protein (TIGR01555 family)